RPLPPPPLFPYTTLFRSSPPLADAHMIKTLLDHGAQVNAKSPEGHTILMIAASSEAVPVEIIQALISRGADVNAKGPHGETALGLARRHGQTAVVDLLIKAGAKDESARQGSAVNPKPAPP